ncbi:MAG: metallophosphoesterase family protein [Steroidobacteraceae bacterium]
MRVAGLISDTHGLLRPEARQALTGVDLIIHAGDIGAPEVLEELRALAPVHAVRGNNDRGPWARGLPETHALEVDGASLYVLHDLNELDLDPAAGGFTAVVTGHSHRPAMSTRDGVLYINPGSAGPRRFSLPVAVGFLEIHSGTARGRIQEIL